MTTIDQPTDHTPTTSGLWVPTASHTPSHTPTPKLWVPPASSHSSHSAPGAVAHTGQDTPAPVVLVAQDDEDTAGPVAHDTHESSSATAPADQDDEDTPARVALVAQDDEDTGGPVARDTHESSETTAPVAQDDEDTGGPVARDTHESDRATAPADQDDEDTAGPVAHHIEEDDTMHVAEIHRDALIALPRKADQVHYICDQLGHPETAEVRRWLDAIGAQVDSKYVSRVVSRWRAERGLTDTGTFRALNAYDLADLEAAPAAAPAAAAIDSPIDPPADDVPAGYLPAIPAVDPAESDLAAKVRVMQARLPLQSEEALLAALSDDELRAERELAEWERATDRKIRRSAKAAQLANIQREQATAEAIAKSEAGDARWLQRAVSARRRLISPDARLAQLHRRSEWSSRALIAVVVLGMVWSGVNVQRNLVPDGDMGNPLYWLSFGIEAMISVPLIVIMMAATTAARWGKEMDRGKVVVFELALLATTVGLNAGPHIGDWARFAEFSIAPVMVGAVIWLHAWVSARYASLILDGDKALSDTHSAAQPPADH